MTPRSWTSARSETTIFLSLTSVTMTSMTLPTCASSAATVASLVDALGSTGARGAMFRSMSSSSSKDARGAVTALGALFFLLRLTSRVLEEVICESGRKARKRPLRTRRMRPPRLATSTRPLTGSPFSSARISAFLASVLLESPSSSSFLALPPGPFLAPSFFAGGLGSFAVAAARTKRTGLDGGMATLRDLVLDERGAGATRLEPTDRARAAPRLAAHCKTDVAIACGDRRVTGWYDRASPSGRTEAPRSIFPSYRSGTFPSLSGSCCFALRVTRRLSSKKHGSSHAGSLTNRISC